MEVSLSASEDEHMTAIGIPNKAVSTNAASPYILRCVPERPFNKLRFWNADNINSNERNTCSESHIPTHCEPSHHIPTGDWIVGSAITAHVRSIPTAYRRREACVWIRQQSGGDGDNRRSRDRPSVAD